MASPILRTGKARRDPSPRAQGTVLQSRGEGGKASLTWSRQGRPLGGCGPALQPHKRPGRLPSLAKSGRSYPESRRGLLFCSECQRRLEKILTGYGRSCLQLGSMQTSLHSPHQHLRSVCEGGVNGSMGLITAQCKKHSLCTLSSHYNGSPKLSPLWDVGILVTLTLSQFTTINATTSPPPQ